MRPRTLILRTAGINCDQETAHAFELAGAEPDFVHVNRVLESPEMLGGFHILAIPGGFSYGDDIAAGRIFANQLVHHLSDVLHRFVEDGKPVIGICNGFQVLVKTDLLPGPIAGRRGQSCTLTNNDCGRFVDRWVHLMPRSGKCVWTKGLEPLDLPVAHGEGKFICADDEVRRALWNNDQVALTYAAPDGRPADGRFPHNPNGSQDDIAAISDVTGLVLGLMPHPERHVDPLQHPSWGSNQGKISNAQGLRLFSNAVGHTVRAFG